MYVLLLLSQLLQPAMSGVVSVFTEDSGSNCTTGVVYDHTLADEEKLLVNQCSHKTIRTRRDLVTGRLDNTSVGKLCFTCEETGMFITWCPHQGGTPTSCMQGNQEVCLGQLNIGFDNIKKLEAGSCVPYSKAGIQCSIRITGVNWTVPFNSCTVDARRLKPNAGGGPAPASSGGSSKPKPKGPGVAVGAGILIGTLGIFFCVICVLSILNTMERFQ